MRVDALRGRNAYRCGCGMRIRVEDLAQPETCCYTEAGVRCRLLPVHCEPVPVCGDHYEDLRRRLTAVNLREHCILDPDEAVQIVAAWLDLTTDGGIDREAYIQRRALRATTKAQAITVRREQREKLRTEQEQNGLVYYIRFGDRIKIGTTTNLPGRLADIPHDELLATEPGGFLLEGYRHHQFAHLRLTGEWFRADAALEKHIKAVQSRRQRLSRRNGNGRLGTGVYLTGSEAAQIFDVHPSTICSWVDKGYLAPADLDGRNHPVYRLRDVAFAELHARESALAAAGTAQHLRGTLPGGSMADKRVRGQ